MSFGKEKALSPRRNRSYAGGVIESAHSGRWFVTPVRTWRYRGRSPYQDIAIGDVEYLGRCLFLDGWIQLAAVDEFIYHEHLVLPALLAHEHPERVLILGGGDGLAARESLRDPNVRQVVMVDLDAMVVSACREHLHDLQAGALDDPRVQVIIGDARDFLRNPRARFDVIIVDLIDLTPDTVPLFEDVFAHVRAALRPGGIVVTHGPDPGPPLHEGLRMVAFLRERFQHVAWYTAYITSFGETWTFGLASDDVEIASLPAETWHIRGRRLTSPPRSFVPRAMSARFWHTEEEERMLDLICRDGENAPPLSRWQSTVVDGQTMDHIREIIGFDDAGE